MNAGGLTSSLLNLVVTFGPSKQSATFELSGFLFDSPERPTVYSVVICSRPLGRRDDKQNDPHRYGQQNRQGD